MNGQKKAKIVRSAFNVGAVLIAFAIMFFLFQGNLKSIGALLMYLAGIDACICLVDVYLKDKWKAFTDGLHVVMWLLLTAILSNI